MKKFRIFVIAFALLFLAGSSLAHAADATKQYRWKFATQAPRGMGYANMVANSLLPAMREATEGNLAWQVYYGGVMGNDDDYVSKMYIGQLQGGGLTLVGTNLISTEFSILALPFLFNGFDEVDYLREVMYPTFDFFFQQRNFKLLMWIDMDFDLFYSTRYPFDRIEHFRQAKILSWSGPIEEAWLRELGANPIPLGIVESPAAIRTGLADSNITTGIWQVGTQVYTTTKFVNLARIRYAPAAIVVTKPAWEELPPSYQRAIMERRPGVQDEFNIGTRKDAQASLEGMIRYGVEPITNSPEMMEDLKRRTMRVWPRFTGQLWPQSLLDDIVAHLAWYRAGGKETLEGQGAATAAQPRPRPAVIEESLVAAPPSRVAPAPAPAREQAARVAPAPVKEEIARVEPAPAVEKIAEVAAAAVPEAPAVEEKAEKTLAVKEVEEVKEPQILIAPPPEVAAVVRRQDGVVDASAAYPMPRTATKEQIQRPQTTWWQHFMNIKAIQEKLQSMGLYDLKIDGDPGPATRKGIREYEKMNNLPVTGEITDALLKHMGIK
ncbi:MAG: TRAP transporter substrate-binding protein DctP [Desulfatibacillaceae bacterium]|nr:TRAP transporter substrate-binding protein DctP [Desulfatibacillaceae bacterium]